MFLFSHSGKQIGRPLINNFSFFTPGECGLHPVELPANFSTFFHVNSKYAIMGPNFKWHWLTKMLDCKKFTKEYGARILSSIARHETCALGLNQVKRGLRVKDQLWSLILGRDRPPACLSRCIIVSLMRGRLPCQRNVVIVDCKVHQYSGGGGRWKHRANKMYVGQDVHFNYSHSTTRGIWEATPPIEIR